MKNGFTLVELSIVLVIIGLLVGGVLIGQSLIDSAKISSQIRQIQQFDIAVSQFKNRFRGIPGDSPLFASDGDGSDADSGRGDGDGLLSRRSGTEQRCYLVHYVGECDEFWKQLSDTKMIEGNYTNDYSTAGIIPDEGAPRAVFEHTNVLPFHDKGIVIGGLPPTASTAPANLNYFALQGNANPIGALNSSVGECIKPINALAFDTKLDDGVPNSGSVHSIQANAMGGAVTDSCLNGSEYNVDTDNGSCIPLFEMLSLAE